MARLLRDLVEGIQRPVPSDPQELFHALVKPLEESRGRRIRLAFETFPPHTASGLWLEYKDHDIIVVEKDSPPVHQLVILGHELWHMMVGRCASHSAGKTTDLLRAAARSLGPDVDIEATVQQIAARTDFDEGEERDAETFGLLLCGRLRPHLDGVLHVPATGLEGRLQATLGHRGLG